GTFKKAIERYKKPALLILGSALYYKVKKRAVKSPPVQCEILKAAPADLQHCLWDLIKRILQLSL
ncbi:MAG: hypothetical protein ACI4DY_09585, partial [Monoglobaceae bacterium]